MIVREAVALAPYTSLGVGGRARFFVEARSLEELREASVLAREQGLPLRVLGSGTNILISDAGIEAVVVKLVDGTYTFETGLEGSTLLTGAAGASWDALVDAAALRGLWGIENLAGIPGSAIPGLISVKRLHFHSPCRMKLAQKYGSAVLFCFHMLICA